MLAISWRRSHSEMPAHIIYSGQMPKASSSHERHCPVSPSPTGHFENQQSEHIPRKRHRLCHPAGRAAVSRLAAVRFRECPLSPNCGHSGPTYSPLMRFIRPLQAVSALAALAACRSTPTTLSPCWRAADLQHGERFRGTVLIFAGYHQRPMIFPAACDGGVTAELPEDVVLPGYRGADFSVPTERLFYEAHVDGEVSGTAFGRPKVRLEHVSDPRQMVPQWLRRYVR